jgi:hypothetical protein
MKQDPDFRGGSSHGGPEQRLAAAIAAQTFAAPSCDWMQRVEARIADLAEQAQAESRITTILLFVMLIAGLGLARRDAVFLHESGVFGIGLRLWL